MHRADMEEISQYTVNAPLYNNVYCTVMEAVHVKTGCIYACKVIKKSILHAEVSHIFLVAIIRPVGSSFAVISVIVSAIECLVR